MLLMGGNSLASSTQILSMSEAIKLYLPIQKALALDNLEEAKKSAQKLEDFLKTSSTSPKIKKDQKEPLRTLLEVITPLLKSSNDEAIRIQFGHVSKVVVSFLKANKDLTRNYHLFFCPMFPKGYAFWIQIKNEPLTNPYWGNKMLECGVKRPW
jgi:hypothetical protein